MTADTVCSNPSIDLKLKANQRRTLRGVRFFVDLKPFSRYNTRVQSNKPEHERRDEKMSEIRVKENESLDSALRRFKRSCAKSGVLAEVRKREHYEKPSVRRKKKSEAARKRKH